MSELAWTQDLPTIPGLYLRNYPPASAILFADVVEVDGALRNFRVNAGEESVPVEWQHRFWWFGPIPAIAKAKGTP